MADKIQPVGVKTKAVVVAETRMRTVGNGDELVPNPVGNDWTAPWYNVDDPTSLDARSFSETFYDGRNKATFERRGSRFETCIGT